MEILTGINVAEFDKRKAFLGSAINSVARYDSTLTENLIFRAFDCFNDYDYFEQRIMIMGGYLFVPLSIDYSNLVLLSEIN